MHRPPRLGAGVVLGGKYVLAERLGGGGMGEVYRATPSAGGGAVAIKLLRREWLDNADVVERFLHEASAANRVHHVNVVAVIEVEQDPSFGPFIVQELLEGQDLETALREVGGKLRFDTAMRVLIPVSDAVGAAHGQGVVHRDIKLGNVYLARQGGRTVPKVLDFGIARVVAEVGLRRMTAAGVMIGTPKYLSPEVVRDGTVGADARSDVWALGVLLYRVLSGRFPFNAEGTGPVFKAICNEPHIPLRKCVPEASRQIAAVLDKCLAKDPDARFANGDAVAEALRDAFFSAPSVGPPPVAPAARGAWHNTLPPVPMSAYPESSTEIIEPRIDIKPGRIPRAPPVPLMGLTPPGTRPSRKRGT